MTHDNPGNDTPHESHRYDKRGNESYRDLDVVRDTRNGWRGTVLDTHRRVDGTPSRVAYVEFAREDGTALAFQWVDYEHLEHVQPTDSGEAS